MKRLVVLSCVVVLLSMLSEAVLGVRDPYKLIEAELMDFNKGASALPSTTLVTSGGKYAGSLQPGDHIGYSQLNFSAETTAFEVQVWNTIDYTVDSQVQLRLDSPTTTPFLTFPVPQSGARFWILLTLLIPVEQRPRGVHDLYFTFTHPTPAINVLAIDWFHFVSLESLLPPSHTLCTPDDNKGGKCPQEDNRGGKWPWEDNRGGKWPWEDNRGGKWPWEDNRGGKWPWEDNKGGKWPWEDNKGGKWPWDNKVNPNNPGGQSHTHWTTDHCLSPDGKQKEIVINIC